VASEVALEQPGGVAATLALSGQPVGPVRPTELGAPIAGWALVAAGYRLPSRLRISLNAPGGCARPRHPELDIGVERE